MLADRETVCYSCKRENHNAPGMAMFVDPSDTAAPRQGLLSEHIQTMIAALTEDIECNSPTKERSHTITYMYRMCEYMHVLFSGHGCEYMGVLLWATMGVSREYMHVLFSHTITMGVSICMCYSLGQAPRDRDRHQVNIGVPCHEVRDSQPLDER